MAITATNINVKGATVRVGGTVITDPSSADWYDVSPAGTDVGCTTGGVTVTYSLDTSDIFCDQSTPPVDVAITGETATVEFSMLESTAENLSWFWQTLLRLKMKVELLTGLVLEESIRFLIQS